MPDIVLILFGLHVSVWHVNLFLRQNRIYTTKISLMFCRIKIRKIDRWLFKWSHDYKFDLEPLSNFWAKWPVDSFFWKEKVFDAWNTCMLLHTWRLPLLWHSSGAIPDPTVTREVGRTHDLPAVIVSMVSQELQRSLFRNRRAGLYRNRRTGHRRAARAHDVHVYKRYRPSQWPSQREISAI